MSHNWRWKYLSMLNSPDMRLFLTFLMALSTLFDLWLLGGINWYLISIIGIAILKAFDASFSFKWDPGLILRIFKSSVNYVEARIISLSLLFFFSVVSIASQSYTYMMKMYLFPILDMIGKRLHRSEYRWFLSDWLQSLSSHVQVSHYHIRWFFNLLLDEIFCKAWPSLQETFFYCLGEAWCCWAEKWYMNILCQLWYLPQLFIVLSPG